MHSRDKNSLLTSTDKTQNDSGSKRKMNGGLEICDGESEQLSAGKMLYSPRSLSLSPDDQPNVIHRRN